MRPLNVLGLWLVSQAALAATPQDYAVIVPIETRGESSAWQFEMDTSAYAWTWDAELRDVQVFNADGQPVPMQIWLVDAAADRLREQRADVALLGLPAVPIEHANGDLRLLVERDAEGRLKRIETGDSLQRTATTTRDWLLDVAAFEQGVDSIALDWTTPDNGVIARFAVEASDDLQGWRSVRNDASVVLLQQDGARIERRVIELDGRRSTYLRLRRLDAGPDLADLRAQALHEQREAGAREPLHWTAAALETPTAGTMNALTRFNYALPAALPIEAIRVELAGDNTLAQVMLSTPGAPRAGEATWTEWQRFVAYRLRQGDVAIDSGDIALVRRVRIREVRLDSTTSLAKAPVLVLGWRPARLAFLAEGRTPFVLAIGHARERRIDTPLTAAIAALRAQLGAQWQPPLATLGTPHEAAGATAFAELPAPHPWRRWLLWGVLVVGAGLVATIALSLLRGKR